MSEDALPQADQAEGAPHPRETTTLVGQDPAQTAFLDAFTGGRMHHAWLISGPRGVGKATLAWKIARFLLANPPVSDNDMFGAPPAPTSLNVAPEHPVAQRVAALSEPGLCLIRRAYDEDKKRFKQQITVDEVRRLRGFFSMSASDGGRRVVIVDAADEMNVNAANALLKVLEEPPENAILLLITHQPSSLLPTIRSRCRELRCMTLPPEVMHAALQAAGAEPGPHADTIAALSGGSVGAALRLLNLDGATLYKDLIALIETFPSFDRGKALSIAEKAAARGQEARYDLLLSLVDILLARLAKSGVGHLGPEALPGEAKVLTRLSPNRHSAQAWSSLATEISGRAQHGRAVNLDPAALVLDMVMKMNALAAEQAA